MPGCRCRPLVLFAALIVGCSGSPAGTATITGKVMLDGKPVTDGYITFIAANGQPYQSAILADSSYRVEGVPLGEAIVTLRDPDPPGEAERMVRMKEGVKLSPLPPGVIPKKYTDEQSTDLRYTVIAGANTWDPPLKK